MMKSRFFLLFLVMMGVGSMKSAEANAPACQGSLTYTTVIYPAYCNTEEWGPNGMHTCTKRAIKTKSYSCNGNPIGQDVDYLYGVEWSLGGCQGSSLPNCAPSID